MSVTTALPVARPVDASGSNVRAHRQRAGVSAVVAVLLLCAVTFFKWKPIWIEHELSQARALLREFRPESAGERLARLPESAETEFLLAVACRRAGELDRVMPHLTRAAELGWDKDEIDRQRTLMQFQAGNFRASGEEVKALLVEQVTDDEAEECYEAVTRGYLSALLLEQAKFMLDGWIAWRPQCVQPYLFRAELASLRNQDEGRVAAYRDVLRISPANLEAREGLARVLMYQHEVDEAYELFTSCLRDYPREPGVLLGLAEWHHRHGDGEKAKTLIDTLLSCEPDHRQRCDALSLLGQILLAERNYEAAERALREAVASDPTRVAVFYELSQALSRLGRADEAKNYLQRWQRLQAVDEELEDLEPEILGHPQDPDLRLRVGRLLLEKGETKAGVNWLLSVLFYEPSHAETNRLLAEHYEQMGEHELARRHRGAAEGGPAAVQGLPGFARASE
jgi:tetratricopeptide (TPR) repeat protein